MGTLNTCVIFNFLKVLLFLLEIVFVFVNCGSCIDHGEIYLQFVLLGHSLSALAVKLL